MGTGRNAQNVTQIFFHRFRNVEAAVVLPVSKSQTNNLGLRLRHVNSGPLGFLVGTVEINSGT
jgi:hypothetical protein